MAKNSHSDEKKINYYAKLFKIDLQFYKPSEFEPNLENILLLMGKKINLEFNHFVNYSIKKIGNMSQMLD
jgi:hypothetical protein